jgi:hypothetical protein
VAGGRRTEMIQADDAEFTDPTPVIVDDSGDYRNDSITGVAGTVQSLPHHRDGT